MKPHYTFLNKTLFFPEQGILAVGDLHIGYDYQLQQSGVLLPENQVKDIIKELKSILNKLKTKIKKIIFIGDIKHSFKFEYKEKSYFNEVLDFLKTKFKDKDIILIKGNHDTIDYSFSDKLQDYYIEDDLCFAHGDKLFPEMFSKNIKTLVIGHIHPSVILSDKQNIKREKYKCFLTGKYKNKNIIILPSFLSTIQGQTINNLQDDYEDYFSIIPKKSLMNFNVHIIGKNKVYDFGKVRDIDY